MEFYTGRIYFRDILLGSPPVLFRIIESFLASSFGSSATTTSWCGAFVPFYAVLQQRYSLAFIFSQSIICPENYFPFLTDRIDLEVG